MDLPVNRFKAALKQGKRQIGLWSTLPDTGLVELLANCGFDWMVIDTEHTATGLSSVMAQLQAVAPHPVNPIVRAGWNDPVEIKRLLDNGAQTILVPYVQNLEEAKAAVAAVRYPPRGMRGVAGVTRASGFGAIKDYVKRADEEICLIVQLETGEALEQIEEIAALDGIDGIFIGPADLAASLGHLGDPGHPEVKSAILDGIRRITAAGKPAGFLSRDAALLQEVAEAGAVFIAVDIDAALIRMATTEKANTMRQLLGA